MKRQIVNILAVALIAVLPLGSLFAQQQQGKGQGKMPGRQKMLQELNLSQDQKDQIQKLRTEHQKQMVDYRSDIAKTRLDIKNLFTSNNPDEDKILDLTKKVSGIQADMKASSIKNWFQIYNLLNDQQKETFRKMAPMLRERMGEGFQKRGKGMMGKGMMQHRGKMAPQDNG
ncbi:MAG: Spy/CpxP family protein refolding chaperone [Bacteroidota bacterium]|jgi:Spy/CpxP family protein refolding chaperone|nr:periplasmic heavy metal sensor [Ignavibacteria bacterium]MCU7501311.1 periplasmic heavy metal sensor [Ignavibacteria bacterium]MCU7512747.1 periplasmic heavy metal sensor [Ignavibacteria bacterium]MCU7520371.1 periplasmic heavy metal sensor [Ignavibacteria bacterium]MCU7523974.1 periplasmic heavy metal sensor [Ignavibacteria bacterium]